MTLNAIIANFQTFKIVDLLDIIIIAFLIYQLLGIINRTRAGQLAKGALLVMVVYLVANTLNMRTVTWLLNSLLQVGLLTLVVLFQPEIRRILEQLGSKNIRLLRTLAPEKELPEWKKDNDLQYEDTILFFGKALFDLKREQDLQRRRLQELEGKKNILRRIVNKCRMLL